MSAVPVNPATNNTPWTQSDWLKATAPLAAQATLKVHCNHPGAVVVGNGLTNGQKFYSSTASTKQLIDGMDAGIAEAWLRLSTAPVTSFPNETAWKQNVGMCRRP